MLSLRRLLPLLLVLACFVGTLSACGTDETPPAVWGIHTELQAQYLAGDCKLASVYAKGNREQSHPLPVELTWSSSGPRTLTVTHRQSGESFSLVADGSAALYNLLPGEYDWSVPGAGGTFSVALQTPRNLLIGGVTNARDLGGWTVPGGRVKQGMLYRTAKLSADGTGETLVTAEGIATLTVQLGVVTELDLRRTRDGENGALTASPLGEGVRYISFPMESSGNVLSLNRERLPELFAILAEAENYPLTFHCSIGTDRTGLVAFLCNALLGVSEEDLYRDYLFSNFADIGGMRTPSALSDYLGTLGAVPGDTLAQKTYRYLTDAGVSPSDLDAFIALMTEPN